MNRKTYNPVACSFLLALFFVIIYAGIASASVICVKSDAAGSANGSSWTDAYTTIQAGVDAASSGDELWVAAGTYTATSSPVVTMKDGVLLYGGFAGTETARDSRDSETNLTIIDGAGAYRCVMAASNITIDGVTIQNGYMSDYGGGLYASSYSGITLSNVIFSGNYAGTHGGAIYQGTYSLLDSCQFSGNSAGNYGGAIYRMAGTVTNCSFTLNSCQSIGGAVYFNGNDSAAFSNCVFTSNNAGVNGGAVSASGIASFDNCTFKNNSAGPRGGAIVSPSSITNCTFIGNTSSAYGGAVFNPHSSSNCVFISNSSSTWGGAICTYVNSNITNCVFIGNSSAQGGGVLCEGIGNSTMNIYNCTFTGNSTAVSTVADSGYTCYVNIYDSVLWGDTAEISVCTDPVTTVTATYSCVKGGYTGTGNISSDPHFYDGSDDGDGYDLRLKSGSPCIDTGTTTSATTDINGLARPQGSAFDMGAYENMLEPVAAFSATPLTGTVPLEVTFTDASTYSDTEIHSWLWDFGDDSTSTDQNPTHIYTKAGSYSVSLTVDTTYSEETKTKSYYITVSRTTPTVTTWPTATGLTYGQALSDSTLNGGAASASGSFVFANTALIPSAGTHDEAVLFVPSDLSSYDIVTGVASVTVTQADPGISTWPTATGLTYGQALSESTLSGGVATADGTFAFSRPDYKPETGTYSATVTFTPTDSVNYEILSSSANVEVVQASPSITTAPTASIIVYGQTLADSTLSGGQAMAGSTAIAGTFSFTDTYAKPDTAGEYLAQVTFDPYDRLNYNAAHGFASVTVTSSDCPECEATSEPYYAGGTACLVVPGTFSSSTAFAWAREDGVSLDASRITGTYCQRLKVSNLKISDSGNYVCTYGYGQGAEIYSVTITVNEAVQVPAQPSGLKLAAVIALMGLMAAWRCRRLLSE